MRERALRCSFNLSLNFLADSPIYSLSQSTLAHLYLHITQLFCVMMSLSLGGHQEVLDSSSSFEIYLYPMFVPNVLDTLTEPLIFIYYHAFVMFHYWFWFVFVFTIFGRLILSVVFELQLFKSPGMILTSL